MGGRREVGAGWGEGEDSWESRVDGLGSGGGRGFGGGEGMGVCVGVCGEI